MNWEWMSILFTMRFTDSQKKKHSNSMLWHCIISMLLTLTCIAFEALAVFDINIVTKEVLELINKINSLVILILILRSLLDKASEQANNFDCNNYYIK